MGITFDKISYGGYEEAMHAMRNPKENYHLGDTDGEGVGPVDLDLTCRLAKAGEEHRKHVRQIVIWVQGLRAPMWWWLEYDTYMVGATGVSTSKMHKLGSRELTMEDFDTDGMTPFGVEVLEHIIDDLNNRIRTWKQTKDKQLWRNLIALLPESFYQKRDVMISMETAIRMIDQRHNHKMDEWHQFCDILLANVPYLKEIYTASVSKKSSPDVDSLLKKIEAINPIDYGSMFSYEAHECVRDFKHDVLKIIEEWKDGKD